MEDQVSALPIVVGIDGSRVGAAALMWAAETASMRGCPLHLLHAAKAQEFDVDAQSRKILAWADRQLGHAGLRHIEVTMSVRRGTPVAVLLHAAENAQLLVLGRLGTGQDAELMLGSTALACTTRSPTPTVVVPPGWTELGRPVPGGGRYLVLGVDGSPACQTAVEFAFAEAAERKLGLTAVHAGRTGEGTRLLAGALTVWREKYPAVAVTERVEFTDSAATLIRAAAHAEVLVVGTGSRRTMTGAPLGSSTQAVLRLAACPVAVVPSPKEWMS